MKLLATDKEVRTVICSLQAEMAAKADGQGKPGPKGDDAASKEAQHWKKEYERVAEASKMWKAKNDETLRALQQTMKAADDRAQALQEIQASLEDWQGRCHAAEQESETLKQQLADAKQQADDVLGEHDATKQQTADALRERDEAQKQLSDAMRERDEAQKQIDDALHERDEARKQAAAAQSARDEAERTTVAAHQETEDLRQQMQRLQKEMDGRFAQGWQLYQRYADVSSYIRNLLEGAIPREGFEPFIVGLSQDRSLGRIWDAVREAMMKTGSEEELATLWDIFQYSLLLVNQATAEDLYEIAKVQPGDAFDLEQHTPMDGSPAEGAITEVFLPGYRNLYSGTLERKSLVQV